MLKGQNSPRLVATVTAYTTSTTVPMVLAFFASALPFIADQLRKLRGFEPSCRTRSKPFDRKKRHFERYLAGFPLPQEGNGLWAALRTVLGIAVVGLLFWQLSNIGWREVISEMPKTPWFYVTVAVMYVTLPIFETGIYGTFFSAPRRALFSVFVRKKVLNSDLVGYSGDVFVLFWLKERLNLTEGKVLRFMVDNGITSSLGWPFFCNRHSFWDFC